MREKVPQILIVGGDEYQREELINKVKKAGLPEDVVVFATQNVDGDAADFLTGCIKYDVFIKRAEELLAAGKSQYDLLYFDVDNMTYINNAFGYQVGNKVLSLIGDSFNDIIDSEGEMIARISDDRFICFLDRDNAPEDESEVGNVFDRALRAIADYMRRMGIQHRVDIYAGRYRIQPEDVGQKTIQQMADFAVTAYKEAKLRKADCVVTYDTTIFEKEKRQNLVINALDEAIANEEIELWFQPQIDSRNGSVVGAEVLCRWNSKRLGFMNPAEFIPIFENNGQICRLDVYVWEKTCQQLAKWHEAGVISIPLSINISRRDIQDLDVGRILAELIHKYDLDTSDLRIEITESAYMNKPEQLVGFVNKLKRVGLMAEMDDFGSGYSSLNMLQEVPVDVLKLDMRFLGNNSKETDGRGSIISSVIRMARSISLDVIAEGVETEEQCVNLHNMGCTIIQGYYYAKPMPLKDFEEYLLNHQISKVDTGRYTEEMSHMLDLLNHNSDSAYVFDNYIGPGAIIEVNADRVEVLKINEKFLDAMGDRERRALNYITDGLALIQDCDRQKALDTIKKAIRTGRGEIETYLPFTDQWVRLVYRLIIKGPVSNYLFVEIYNTTDKQIMGKQFQRYMKRAESTLEAIPSGVFKYSADGRQDFAYVSRSMLWLLGYKTREEFLEKFNNNFPEMIYIEDRERVLKEIDDQITENQHLDYCEYRIEMADGNLKWVSDYGRFVTDEDGRRWYYVVISDADAARAAKADSAYRKKELDILAAATGVSTIEYDPRRDSLKIHYIDKKTGQWQLLEYSQCMELITDRDMFTEEAEKTVRDNILKCMRKGENLVFHFEFNMLGDSFKRYRCNCGCVHDENGKIEKIVGVIMV